MGFCEKQIVEYVFKIVHANLLVQAQSLVSLFLLLAGAWLRLVGTERILQAQSAEYLLACQLVSGMFFFLLKKKI